MRNRHAGGPRIRWLLAIAAAVTLTLTNPGGALAATAKKPAISGTGAAAGIPAEALAQMRAQQPLSNASDQIQEAVHSVRAAGFTGIAIQGGKLAVWWKKGIAMPGAVSAAVTAARRSVTVELKAAPYSLAELEKAQAGIIDQIRDNPRPLHGVKIPSEGTGLIVSAVPGTTNVAAKAAETADAAGVDVPITTVTEEPVEPGSRANDSPPWRGGAQIVGSLGGLCSTGFGVTFLGVSDFILTASHCSFNAAGGFVPQSFFDRTGEFIGNSSAAASDTNRSHDISLIGPTSVRNEIYDGPVGAGEFTKFVSGWTNPTVGERVCVSGSFSGTNCDYFNTNINYTYCSSNYPGFCPVSMVAAERRGGVATVPGDSGSPFFTVTGNSLVAAKGVHSAAGGNIVAYQDFATAVADFNIVPKP